MKINELLSESDVTEAPWFGGVRANVGSAAQGLGTWAMSKLGSGTAKAKLDVNQRSNEIYKSFKDWALRANVGGQNLTAVTLQNLNSWLKNPNVGLPVLAQKEWGAPGALNLSLKDQNGITNSQRIFKTIAQKAFGAGGMPGTNLGSQYGVSTPVGNQGAGGGQSINSLITQLGSLNLNPAQKQRLQDLLTGTP
jgi:hypothetical protein